MASSASRLRQVVYRLLEQVLRTGQPLEIERHGQVLRCCGHSVPAKSC